MSLACRISPTIASAETNQNEQIRNVPSFPDSPSSVSLLTATQFAHDGVSDHADVALHVMRVLAS